MTKIIIIGFGSIGRRHYKNLLKLGYKDIYVFDVDKKKIKGKKNIDRLDSKTLENFDAAFICTPTHLHIKTALTAAKAGCHLFIEKPLSNNFKDINKLIRICKRKKLTTMVGCNLRFEPALRKIKQMIDKKYLGKIYLVYLEYGRYLPYQRPGFDYKKTYAAKRKTGGGIILDDIHSFDLAFWLNNFKKIKKIEITAKKLSSLKINVEDIFISVIVFENNVIADIRSDYLQKYKHRNCKIIGEKGNLFWDFRKNRIELEKDEKKIEIFKPRFSNPFLDEIRYFLLKADKRQKTFNDLERSLKILRIILKNKKI